MIITLLPTRHYAIAQEPAHDFIRRQRLTRGWTQAKLAIIAGCDRVSVINIESGKNRSLKMLILLLEGLGYRVQLEVIQTPDTMAFV